MATETQHTKWREDINSNARHIGEIIGQGKADTPEGQVKTQLAIAMIGVTGQTMIAERLGELCLAMARSDELVATLYDQVEAAKPMAERVLNLLSELGDGVEDPRIEDAILGIREWQRLIEPANPLQPKGADQHAASVSGS